MDVVALDGSKLVALMAAGGAFALAGLWLMFRPQPGGGAAARIELFGAKFQASSAGLLVFLIGAGFLMIPVVVPEKPGVQSGSTAATAGQPLDGASRSVALEEHRPSQIAIEAAEEEPNDTIPRANRVSLGSMIAGELGTGDADFFVVDIPEDVRGDLVAAAHSAQTVATLEILDEAGAPLSNTSLYGSGSVARGVARPRYYVSLRNAGDEPGRYTLTIAVREP